MDDWCDEREPELCHGGCVRKVLLVVVHKNVLLKWFSTIMQETGEENHTRGVWLTGNGSRAEYLLAVMCRVFMGLEEGLPKTADKGGSEIGIAGCREQGLQEGKGSKPFLLLHPEKRQETVQLGKGDGEPFTEPLHCREVQEILRQNAEEEEEAIAGVRDDEVREDGMGMAAGTDQAQDAEAVSDGDAAYEIDQRTVVVGMDPAGTLCSTVGAGL